MGTSHGIVLFMFHCRVVLRTPFELRQRERKKMRTFLISYDLARPHRNKHVLAQAIMSLGQSWARPLEQTWYVRTSSQDEESIEAKLSDLLDIDDGLIVQAVAEEAALTNTSLRWFRQRRAGVDVVPGGNVLAFPAVPAAPATQAELPLRQAG